MKLVDYVTNIPPHLKVVEIAGVWGAVLTGWVQDIQPWLTAAATLLAIFWTSLQIYGFLKKKK